MGCQSARCHRSFFDAAKSLPLPVGEGSVLYARGLSRDKRGLVTSSGIALQVCFT